MKKKQKSFISMIRVDTISGDKLFPKKVPKDKRLKRKQTLDKVLDK